MSRAELFDVVRVTGIRSFAELVGRHGTGQGCEICKPAVASMFASLASGYILDGEQASLQDTNDHFLANLQRDGTYSVVPRVPGGEITPEKLIVIGEVARDFDLYTKITGGQRIDLLGARVDDLPAIWATSGGRRLRVGPRVRQGRAHGEDLRGLDVVPLRRAGLRAARRRPGAALPGPAGPPQDQAGGVGLRPRVRRGAGQGRRRHRHREGLEPLRGRQRRHAPRARRAPRRGPRHRDAGAQHRPLPHVVHPHRRPARAHGDVAAQAARAASTTSAEW